MRIPAPCSTAVDVFMSDDILILSFVTLTVAEMMAATYGIGWYTQYYHQFANYDRVIAGMILMIVTVIVVMYFFDNVQKYFLSWHPIHGEAADSASSLTQLES